MGRELAQEKFLNNIADCAAANCDERILKGQRRPIAILGGIVQIGNAACGEVSDDKRVIRLPAPVIALTDDSIRNGKQHPRLPAACPFIEISWILLQQGWQYGAANKSSRYEIGIGGAVTLRIALRSLSISAEGIVGLLDSREDANDSKRDRIHRCLPCQLELQLRRERDRLGVVADIKIRDDAEQALLLLNLDLVFRHLFSGQCHLHVYRGANGQFDLGKNVVFPGVQNPGLLQSRKAGRCKGQLKRPRSYVRKNKVAIAVGTRFSFRGHARLRQGYCYIGDNGSISINHRTANASQLWPISRLLRNCSRRFRSARHRGRLRLSQCRNVTRYADDQDPQYERPLRGANRMPQISVHPVSWRVSSQ